MLILSSLALIVAQGLLVQSKSILPEVIKFAVASSFRQTADILHVVIETDFDENKEMFIDTIDNISIEDWTFRFQIDVNNKLGQAVSDHNLWFVDSYQAFQRLLPWIRGYHKDSQLFYFIVLKNSKGKDYLHLTEKIFSDFLMLMIANVNVIIETASGEILFYTFNPYQEFACQSAKPLLTHRFSNSSIKPTRQFFPPKADNFHGCPLRIKTRNALILSLGESPKMLANYDLSVLELIMVKEFASRINFTFEIYTDKYGAPVLQNDTLEISTETNELMTEGKTDLMVGFYKNDLLENYFLSKSETYCFSWLVICLHPRPNTFRKHVWLFVPFTMTTWIFTFVSLTLITGSIVLARKINCIRSILHLPGGLEILSVAIGTSVGHLSRKSSLRFSFIVLSFSTLVLRAAYQGKLFDAYRGRTMSKSPRSIRELFAENYTIYADVFHRSIIHDLNKMEYFNLQKLEGSFLSDIGVFESDKRNALVASNVFIYTFFTAQQRSNIVMEIILGEQICMYFQQHSVIKPKVNDIIMRMEKAGILHHLRRNCENFKNGGISSNKNRQEPHALVLENFALTFYAWSVFCAVSCVVFVGELLWHKIN